MKNLIRLLLVGLLASTTGCFGWTENTIERYCGCHEVRADASRAAYEQRMAELESRDGGQFSEVASTLREIEEATGTAPKSATTRFHTNPSHDPLDLAIASVAVPTVAVAEVTAMAASTALLIVFFPIVIYAWPTC